MSDRPDRMIPAPATPRVAILDVRAEDPCAADALEHLRRLVADGWRITLYDPENAFDAFEVGQHLSGYMIVTHGTFQTATFATLEATLRHGLTGRIRVRAIDRAVSQWR